MNGPTEVRSVATADSHCEPMASGIRGERIFDWLDEQIPA
jgi:hypothetical protein